MVKMELDKISTVLLERGRFWGITVFAFWAAVLAFLALANIMVLSRAVELYGFEVENQGQVWLILIMNIIFGLGFAVSAYGLWKKRNWGRLLFLWFIVTWSAFNIVALFAFDSAAGSLRMRAFNTGRHLVGPVVSLWYLNLARIKGLFGAGSSEKFLAEKDKNE
jgi:hypothetical protein